MMYAINKRTNEHRKVCGIPGVRHGERLVQADDDGWIPWEGGERPLPEGSRVKLKTRNGVVSPLIIHVGSERWGHGGGQYDIIAYRPVLDEPEAPEWDGIGWPPPIGCILESFSTGKDGPPAEVLAIRQGHVIGCLVETGVACWLKREHCRPLRSAEDKAVESIHDYIIGSRSQAVAIYAAIRDGKIPGIKLEGDT